MTANNNLMISIIDPAKRAESDFAVVAVGMFAQQKHMTQKEAFDYLYSFKGIDFLRDCYSVEHTLSFEDTVDDLTEVCIRNGGTIQ